MPIIKPARAAPSAPAQPNQPSRKGKKAWRKNVDVSEIQEGLEAVRDEVITGGIIAEKASEDLFMLDVSGDSSIPKKYLKTTKPLRADEIIAARSAVPSVSMRKRPGSKTTDGILDPKRQRTSYVSHKEMMRLRAISNSAATSTFSEPTDASYDPWSEAADVESAKINPRFDFLPKAEKTKAPTTLKHKPISLAASGKSVPAVLKPQGGYSYNPVIGDYIARLESTGQKELEAEQKRQAAAEAERVKAEASARSAAEAVAAEAKAEMSEWDEESAWEGLESDVEGTGLKAKRPERKSQVQRNKIKRRKEEERKQKMLAEQKRRAEQAKRIKEFAIEVAEKEALRAAAKAAKEAESSGEESDADNLELRRRKLGKIRLPEKDLELVLPDELQDSLRLLKPEGNLLKDRWRSMIVRGKVENRRPISFAKKRKVDVTEKWTHKDFMLH